MRDGQPVLADLDHPALADCRDAPAFIGLTPDGPRFAADLGLWVPHEDAETIGQFTDASNQLHPAFPGRGVRRNPRPDDRHVASSMASASRPAVPCWAGTRRIASAAIAASRRWSSCPAGSANARPAARRISRAPTRWSIMVDHRAATTGCSAAARSGRERMYSLLAGFVEPGAESIESPVGREVLEDGRSAVGRGRRSSAGIHPGHLTACR